MRPVLGIILVLFALGAFATAQQEEPQPEPGIDFVSGTVVELPPGRIVVNRAIPGKSPEHRTFHITADTKVEGQLRTNVRVTVGFRAGEEGDPVAVRVIVRNQPRNR